MNAYMNQYQNTQVTTASPDKLLIMLYDGAIRFVVQAKIAMAVGQQVQKREAISRALAIISYLSETLDHDAGWEQSLELDGLYSFMMRELSSANLRDDSEALGVVEGLLKDLREAWQEAVQIVQRERANVTETRPAVGVADYRPLSVAL